MSEAREVSGRCMCGAVTVRAVTAKPILRACHCDMCRRWSSSMFMSLPTEPGSIQTDGPIKTFRSSEWAERAFCDTCGSAIWYMTVGDQTKQLAAGLFDNAANANLKLEFFSDKTPDGYAMSGEHRRMTGAECMALFAPQDETESKS